MNKKLIVLSYLTVLLALPVFGLAFNSGGVPNPVPSLLVGDIVDIIFNIIWPVVVAFAIISFIVAAILFMTAQDNPLKLIQARQALMLGVIGVVVALLAFSIPFVVRNAIGFGI